MSFMIVHLPEEEKSGQLVSHVAMNKFKFCVSPEFLELANFTKFYEKKQGEEGVPTKTLKQKPPDAVPRHAVTARRLPFWLEKGPTLPQQGNPRHSTDHAVKEEPGERVVIGKAAGPTPDLVERAVTPGRNRPRLDCVIPYDYPEEVQEHGDVNEHRPDEGINAFGGKKDVDRMCLQKQNSFTGIDAAALLEEEGSEAGNVVRDKCGGGGRVEPIQEEDTVFPDFGDMVDDVGGLDVPEDQADIELNLAHNGEERPTDRRMHRKEQKVISFGLFGGDQKQRRLRPKTEVEDEEDDDMDEDVPPRRLRPMAEVEDEKDEDMDEDIPPVPKRRRSSRNVPPAGFYDELFDVKMKVQPEEDLPECPVDGCHDKFSGSLEEHMESHPSHSKCRECLHQCKCRADLRVHYRTHTGERPFSCNTCQKAFHRRQHLKSHQEIHSGVKPFKCTECQRGFVTAFSLRRHSSHVHPEDGIQKHEKKHPK